MARDRSAQEFYPITMDHTFKGRILELKIQKIAKTNKKPFVVISGAGPAGLIRAIQSVSNGNPTKVIEKRAKDARGRNNSVALDEKSVNILKYWGIYPYLVEKKLIYPLGKAGYISVRLTHLEQAMKAVLDELSTEPVIEYDTKIVDIQSRAAKASLITESSTGERGRISAVDLFVNAEGARSTTNELLQAKRQEVLPPVPIMVAMCRDDRPEIIDLDSFFTYVGKSFSYYAVATYYNTLFFFQYIYSEDFRKQIAAALILPTPGQNYVGCAFTDAWNATSKMVQENKTKEEYQAFAEHWINLAICSANLLALISWFKGGTYFHTGHHFPIAEFYTAQSSADYAIGCFGEMDETKILLTGDAVATVDPATGQGCNTAIQSSEDYLDFIKNYEKPSAADRLNQLQKEENMLAQYQHKTYQRIASNNQQSVNARKMYRPDALGALSMFKNKTPASQPGRDEFGIDPLLI